MICASCLILSSKNKTSQCGRHYSFYFADEEFGAQRGSEPVQGYTARDQQSQVGNPLLPLPGVYVFTLASSSCGPQQMVLSRPQAAPLWHGKSPKGTQSPVIQCGLFPQMGKLSLLEKGQREKRRVTMMGKGSLVALGNKEV